MITTPTTLSSVTGGGERGPVSAKQNDAAPGTGSGPQVGSQGILAAPRFLEGGTVSLKLGFNGSCIDNAFTLHEFIA